MESRTSSRPGRARGRAATPAGRGADEITESGEDGAIESENTESIGGAVSQRPARSATHTHEQSSGIFDTIKSGATSQLTTQKDRATDGIGTLAQAVRQTTERLRSEDHDTVAQYVERAAEQLERLSQNLREKDVSELLDDAQRLARRQPAMFIGGSFAVGLLAARFLKSSRETERGGTYDYPDSPSRGAY